ncbi:MAG TPA: ABC transporter permease [Bryobacteraceae bacterium]|jgi:predicted permease|nr:ABC transporter permease [Bryobacteraceae bacterium]
MRSLYEDLRYALRVLRGSPGFTAVAVLTLALGIAANATVFGWIDTLLVHPFPGVRAGGELVSLETVSPIGEYSTTAYRDYRDYRDRLQSFSGLAASLFDPFTVGPVSSPRRAFGEYVSGNYFAVLGVTPARGRSFLPSEYGDRPSAFPVTVISDALWRGLLHGDPAAVGKTIRVNRYELTVIGIMPPQFHGTMPGMLMDLWIPMTMAPQLNGQGNWLLEDRSARQTWITGRLRRGVSVSQANAEAEACARHLAEESPRTNRGFDARVMPVWAAHYGVQTILLAPLRILMAVCMVLFLIVGANVANLQLARASARRKELSVRIALGAGRWRLMRQLLTESLLLAFLGGLCGVPLAAWLGGSLLWMLPPIGFPLEFDFSLNGDMLGFTLLLCCAGSMLTGLALAVHPVRGSLMDALKEGGRGGTSGVVQNRTRGVLVISEVALALVALVGTAVATRSFQAVRAIRPGFDAHNVLFAKYRLDTFAPSSQERAQFCLRLRDTIGALPGVAAVSFSDDVPLELGARNLSQIAVEGYVPAAGEQMGIAGAIVAPAYFETLRIPLLAGREFRESDDAAQAPVAIVNRTFALRYFGGANPVGRRIRGGGPWVTIIGEVRDSKYRRLLEPAEPFLYTPYRQTHGDQFWIAFFIRTGEAPRTFIPPVQRTAAAIDPNAGVTDVVPFEDDIAGSVYAQKVAAALLTVLGAVSLFLAALGLYSVLAYSVSQREHEFGIRLALGAKPANVVGLVLGRGLVLTLAGLLLGTLASLAGMRATAGLWVGVAPGDPVAIGGAALFLGVVALLASYLPARRATRVDPMVTLRDT